MSVRIRLISHVVYRSHWNLGRDLATDEAKMWRGLTDKNLKEGTMKQSNDQPVEVKIIRCYEPEERDQRIYSLESEPSIIDGKLEIVNAVTDLME